MYNAKERDVREGAEDKKKYQIKRTRPNTPKFDAIIADKESILLRQSPASPTQYKHMWHVQ